MQYFWETSGWEARDRHLKSLSSAPFQRALPFVPTKPGLYVIRGPRQVGKSTWMKLILQHHINAGNKAFYQSCEDIPDYHSLTAVLEANADRDVIILDEISFVQDWFRPIKKALDNGDNRIFVLTGSNSIDLLKGADRMPGRFGAGGEFILQPMDFTEFSQMRRLAHWPKLSHVEELELYFKVGGFPYALTEAGPEGKRPTKAIAIYQSWLEGDVVKLDRQAQYLKEIMIVLAETMQTPISLQTLAKKTQIGSHHTVQDYIQILENSFALRTLYAIDPNNGGFRYRTNKKFYFTDPLVYWAAQEWAGKKANASRAPALAEMVANEALQRKHKRIGFLSTTSHGEIDFYSKEESWALEVKWSSEISTLSTAYKNAKVQNKIIWTADNLLQKWP